MRQNTKTPTAIPIPGWMDSQDLRVMAQLARNVPDHGLIVEIGSWMGQSTQCWALNTNASVIAIDLWEWMPKEYTGPYPELVNLKGDPFAQFSRNTAHLKNIIPLRRNSSGGEWEHGAIDIAFIDAMHQNPWVAEDIAYWEPKVRPGGIICGDDYAEKFPAVMLESRALADRLGVALQLPGKKFWMVRKPL